MRHVHLHAQVGINELEHVLRYGLAGETASNRDAPQVPGHHWLWIVYLRPLCCALERLAGFSNQGSYIRLLLQLGFRSIAYADEEERRAEREHNPAQYRSWVRPPLLLFDHSRRIVAGQVLGP